MWGVLRAGGYETGDVAIGLGAMGLVAGLIVALCAVVVADLRRRGW